jgi:hypothetical protein
MWLGGGAPPSIGPFGGPGAAPPPALMAAPPSPLQQLIAGNPSGQPSGPPPLPPSKPAIVPARAPGRAPPPGARPERPAADLAGYLASNYGGGPDDALAAEGGTATVPSARAFGMTPIAETRQLAPVKLGALDESELEEQRDKTYAGEADLLDAERDATRMARWADKVGQTKREDIEKGFLAKQESRTQNFRDMLAKHDAELKDIQKTGIEEPTYWTGSVGRDILGAIGLFMIGYAAGPEAAMQQINTVIDRNLAVQKERIAKRKDEWKNRGLLLDRAAQIYDDEAHRDVAAKELALSGLEATLQRFRDYAKDPAEQARADLLLAQAREKRVLTEAQNNEMFADQVTQQSKLLPKGPAAVDPLKALEREKKLRELEGWDPKLYVPAANGYALNDKDAEELKNGGIEKNNLVRSLTGMKKIANDAASGRISSTEAGRRFDALHTDAMGHYNKAAKFGALDKGTQEILDKAMPSLGLTTANAGAAYQQLIDLAHNGYTNALHERGVVDGPEPRNFRAQKKPKHAEKEGGE